MSRSAAIACIMVAVATAAAVTAARAEDADRRAVQAAAFRFAGAMHVRELCAPLPGLAQLSDALIRRRLDAPALRAAQPEAWADAAAAVVAAIDFLRAGHGLADFCEIAVASVAVQIGAKR